MKQEHLFEAIGLVDDRLVEEAADARHTATPWKKWLATAACLAAVIGVGSLAVGTMFRGCGAESGASADGAAPPNYGVSGEAAPAEPPPETPADAAGAAESDGGSFDAYAGPILPLTADAEGLTAERRVVLDLTPLADGEHAAVTDSYVLHNPAAQDETVTLHYPVAASLNDIDAAALRVTADGAEAALSWTMGSALGGLSDDGRSLRQPDWEAYRDFLTGDGPNAAAESGAALEQPVTVWRFTDVSYDEATAESGATLAVSFEQPADTTVLTRGINGFGVDGDTAQYSFFVRSQQGGSDLVFLGTAPEAYDVRGYVDGGCGREQDDVTGSIEIRTMTLGDYLRQAAGSDAELQALTEQLRYTVLGDTPAARYDALMLEDLLMDARAARRVFCAAFEVTVPAGGDVEVTAEFRREASINFYKNRSSDTALRGYDLLTTAGSTLTFTEQNASLAMPEGMTIAGQSFGFAPGGGEALLDADVPRYWLEVREGGS